MTSSGEMAMEHVPWGRKLTHHGSATWSLNAKWMVVFLVVWMWFGKIVLRYEFQQMKQYIKVKQIQVLPNAYVLNREVWRISRHTNKKIAGCIWLWTGCGEQIFQKCPTLGAQNLQIWMNLACWLMVVVTVSPSYIGFSKKMSGRSIGLFCRWNCRLPRRSKSNVSSMSGKTYEASLGGCVDVIHGWPGRRGSTG